jgi:hypothetical protein
MIGWGHGYKAPVATDGNAGSPGWMERRASKKKKGGSCSSTKTITLVEKEMGPALRIPHVSRRISTLWIVLSS